MICVSGARNGKVMDNQLTNRMMQAAQLVADEVRKLTGAWSTRIPGATSVFNDSTGIGVSVNNMLAPSADPNEYGKRHPLFARKGSKRYRDSSWYATPHRPFLVEAMDAKQDECTDVIGSVIDDWAKDAGWDN